jgi:hypothetical protein
VTSILTTVLSGGQTGVDQAALRAARHAGLRLGGWCPPGRQCQSGTIPAEFPLEETPEERSPDAPGVPRSMRSEWNVRDSDATLILRPATSDRNDPGTDWTAACAARYGRPTLVCDPDDPSSPATISRWLSSTAIATLNVAGPSEEAHPGVGRRAYDILRAVFSRPRG